jgi:hypothetical protein
VADLLPFQAYQWNDATKTSTMNLLNFNTPVNPSVATAALAKSYTYASQVLDAYGNASGGTGFNISASGFSSIDYVRIASGMDGYAVVDSIAAVDPVPEPAAFVLFGMVALILLRRRQRWTQD